MNAQSQRSIIGLGGAWGLVMTLFTSLPSDGALESTRICGLHRVALTANDGSRTVVRTSPSLDASARADIALLPNSTFTIYCDQPYADANGREFYRVNVPGRQGMYYIAKERVNTQTTGYEIVSSAGVVSAVAAPAARGSEAVRAASNESVIAIGTKSLPPGGGNEYGLGTLVPRSPMPRPVGNIASNSSVPVPRPRPTGDSQASSSAMKIETTPTVQAPLPPTNTLVAGASTNGSTAPSAPATALTPTSVPVPQAPIPPADIANDSAADHLAEAGTAAGCTVDCGAQNTAALDPIPQSSLPAVASVLGPLARPKDLRIDHAVLQAAADEAFSAEWSMTSWKQAMAPRQRARELGGGMGRGNKSKFKCAAAVKDAALEAGICTSRPEGNAIDLFKKNSLVESCPGVKSIGIQNPKDVQPPAIIVYSGHAGKRVHNYGHVESVLLVTTELLQKIKRDPQLKGVKVGDKIFCSDYCKTYPSYKSWRNPVAAVYKVSKG